MSTIHLGSQKIALDRFATQSNANLGIRSSGKTYTATWIAEQLLDAKIPFVTFDPIGVWRFMRVPGKGKGFKVVIAGENGDLPLTPETAPDIVRAAMRENIPLVIDLYSMHLSKADWKKIVEHSVRILFYENGAHGMRHVFIEEAAEFVPQILQYPEQKTVYAEIEKLSRMGRNVGLGLTLINQRAEQINKAVLENCNRLFLHRQKGRRSLKALEEWIEVAHDISADRAKELRKTVPGLKAGQCLLMDEHTDEPEFVNIPEKQSLHPEESWTAKERAEHWSRRINVDGLVKQLDVALGEARAKIDATDPKKLQKRIRELEVLAARAKEEQQIKEVPVLSDSDRECIAKVGKEIEEALQKHEKAFEAAAVEINGYFGVLRDFKAHLEKAQKIVPGPRTGGARLLPAGIKLQGIPGHVVTFTQSKRLDKPKPLPKAVRDAAADQNGELAGGQRRILIALAQRLPGLTKEQIGVRAGLSSGTGSFGQHMARLKECGYISTQAGKFFITQEGVDALGHFEPLPSGRGLYEYWVQNQLEDGAARILTALYTAYPKTLSKEEIGAETGLSHSTGSFGQHIAKLRRLELIEGSGSALRASEELFE